MKKRSNSVPRTFKDVATTDSALKSLIERCDRIETLARYIDAQLDPLTAKHVQISAVEGDCLSLIVDSPAWAAKIRYAVPEILQALSNHHEYATIRNIRVKLGNLKTASRPSPPKRRLEMSENAKFEMRNFADSVEDAKLAERLRRLADR